LIFYITVLVRPTQQERVQGPADVDGRTLDLRHLLRAISVTSRPTVELAPLLSEGGGALGPRHPPLLLMVSLEERLTVGELVSRVGLAPATTSMLANELNRAGLRMLASELGAEASVEGSC
jgi:hypothetical protein